jgi:hypothetical protein
VSPGAERTYAGVRAYDERQGEVKRKPQAQIYEREVRRIPDGLWKRTRPQIWVDGRGPRLFHRAGPGRQVRYQLLEVVAAAQRVEVGVTLHFDLGR